VSRWEGKYVIGLTGNIGVGKTVVRQMLQHLGAHTIDADELTHQVMAPGAPAYQPVTELFGKIIIDEAGKINRRLLGQIVFSVPEALARLEAIIHPIVTQYTSLLINHAKQRVVVVEAIKLIESGFADALDSIWVVDASPETQLRRLVEKRKMTPEEARKRMLTQPPQAQKIARANVVIKNDGSVEETWKQVQAAWNEMARALNASAAAAARTGKTGALPAQPKAAPAVSAPAAAASAPPTLHKPIAPIAPPASAPDELVIRRGMPKNAEAIAAFIGGVTGRNITRQDVMAVFGPKSYLLCEDKSGAIQAAVGWQVENLITRTDELYLSPTVHRESAIRLLLTAVEDAASQLQSEVSFVFLPQTTGQDILNAILSAGYAPVVLDQIKSLAWREAVREVMDSKPGLIGMMKQLRDEVRTPI
jgi:dephospho-CoA kinase